jgi:hypothetical protein
MPSHISIYLFLNTLQTLVTAWRQLGGLQLERQINCVSSSTAGRVFACKVVEPGVERCSAAQCGRLRRNRCNTGPAVLFLLTLGCQDALLQL